MMVNSSKNESLSSFMEKKLAYRLILDYLCGADMYIIVYTPVSSRSSRIMDNLACGLDRELAQVDLDFARMHEKCFVPTGVADVEECHFIEKIRDISPRDDDQSVEAWLGAYPKWIDWKNFLTE